MPTSFPHSPFYSARYTTSLPGCWSRDFPYLRNSFLRLASPNNSSASASPATVHIEMRKRRADRVMGQFNLVTVNKSDECSNCLTYYAVWLMQRHVCEIPCVHTCDRMPIIITKELLSWAFLTWQHPAETDEFVFPSLPISEEFVFPLLSHRW